jgi:hypothetical protein
VPAAASTLPLPAPKFLYMFGDAVRWPAGMRWRYNHTNAPPEYSDADSAVRDLRRTFDAWSAVCGIRHVYDGLTTTPPNNVVGGRPDLENVVGWAEGDGTYAGKTFAWWGTNGGVRVIADADVVLSPRWVTNRFAMERVAKHEWGHAIGLDHSDLEDQLMSGPPETRYNNVNVLTWDDVRGCRCLYGPAEGTTAGYSCSFPTSVDLGTVPASGSSAPRAVTLTNDGTSALTINSRYATIPVVSVDSGCAPGTSIPPGGSCTIHAVATPAAPGTGHSQLVFQTSDGPYLADIHFTATAGPPASPTVVDLVEYLHAGFGHYFVTTIADEIRKLDDGTIPGWQRTGRTMRAWAQPQGLPPTVPVCRFFSARFAPKSSNFYTASAQECADVKGNGDWQFEGEVFHVALPDATGACASGMQAIYRLYNNGLSGAPNHRFTTDAALRTTMIGQGWTPEGAGLGVTMCGTM